ncbi:hypothetical protein [Rhodanobacter lindaniclasticus]
MNAEVAHAHTRGEAKLAEHDGMLTIDIQAAHCRPGQHGALAAFPRLHRDDQPAHCPTMANDANHDGYIDLIETEKFFCTTMVPFIAQPASMDVAHGHYPTADAKGDYHYTATVALKDLDAAFAKAFPDQRLDLAKRVIYIHGVPADTKLPATVASLGPIPAQVTLPIACGQIEMMAAEHQH